MSEVAEILEGGGFDWAGVGMRWSFHRSARRIFYMQLASFVAEGLPPYRTIKRINEIAEARLAVRAGPAGTTDRLANMMSGKRRRLRARTKLLQQVLGSMDRGKGLGAALRRWVPHEEAEMLRTGESADRLVKTLGELQHLLEVKIAIATTLRNGALGALGRLAVLVGMMFYILTTVLAEARMLVPDEMFNQLTLAPLYFRFGELFLAWFVPSVVFLVAAGVCIAVSLPRWRPNGLRSKLDNHVPPYSLYSRVHSATLLTSASAMMEAGRQLRESLVSLSQHGSPWLRTHCRRMLVRLQRGMTDADALRTGMLPWELEDQLATYAMLGDFKRVMRALARESLDMVQQRVKAIGFLMSLATMLLLGAFIIFTIFSIGEIALEAQSAIDSNVPEA